MNHSVGLTFNTSLLLWLLYDYDQAHFKCLFLYPPLQSILTMCMKKLGLKGHSGLHNDGRTSHFIFKTWMLWSQCDSGKGTIQYGDSFVTTENLLSNIPQHKAQHFEPGKPNRTTSYGRCLLSFLTRGLFYSPFIIVCELSWCHKAPSVTYQTLSSSTFYYMHSINPKFRVWYWCISTFF